MRCPSQMQFLTIEVNVLDIFGTRKDLKAGSGVKIASQVERFPRSGRRSQKVASLRYNSLLGL